MTKKSGFTLIEILVSTGVLALLGLILTQVFVSTTKSNTKTEISKEVKQNGDYAVGVITRMLQNAYDITSACASAGTSGESINLLNPDGGTTTFGCTSDSGVLRVASGSAFLTSSGVTLVGATCAEALTITCTSYPNESKSVKVNFSLAQKGTPPDNYEKASAQFQTTVRLRNK